MYIIDTHSHIYLPDFDEDSEAVMQRALDAGVKKILLPNIDLNSLDRVNRLCDDYPRMCFPMLGLHPCDVKDNFQEVLSELYQHFARRRYVAIGEIGIDLHWDKTTLPQQIEAFKVQVNWGKKYELPIVIHARESFNEIFEVLDEMNDDNLSGVFHCFTGTKEQAEKIMGYGNFVMGIGGVLTYPKAELDKIVADIPMEYLVLETDSPYLTPKPHRGKRNESAYTRIIAEKLAEAKNLSLDEIISQTTVNAERLFKV